MALDIKSATHGYDISGIEQMEKRINDQVISEAAKKLETNKNTLFEAVDKIWVGNSADTFKRNIEVDVDSIKKALLESKRLISIEITQIITAMMDTDDKLVKPRH